MDKQVSEIFTATVDIWNTVDPNQHRSSIAKMLRKKLEIGIRDAYTMAGVLVVTLNSAYEVWKSQTDVQST